MFQAPSMVRVVKHANKGSSIQLPTGKVCHCDGNIVIYNGTTIIIVC